MIPVSHLGGPDPSANSGHGPATLPPPTQASPQLTAPASTLVKSRSTRWRRFGFALLNTWLVIHLTAIVIAPATVGPSSQTSRFVWELVSPYLQILYLNHGFHYFAPEPGSSNLISWTVTRSDGTSVSGRFPNFKIFPRLLYHRHFMLSEFLGNAEPEMQSTIVRGFARNLCREYNGDKVSITLIRHELSTMERVRTGGKLDDGDLYEEELLGAFDRKDLL